MSIALNILHLDLSEEDARALDAALTTHGFAIGARLVAGSDLAADRLAEHWDLIVHGGRPDPIELSGLLAQVGSETPLFLVNDELGAEDAAALLGIGATGRVHRRDLPLFPPLAAQALAARRQRAEAARNLAVSQASFAALRDLGRQSQAPLQDLIDIGLRALIGLTGSGSGFLCFVDEKNGSFTLHAQRDDASSDCPMENYRQVCSIDEAGLWVEPLRQRRPIIVNDYRERPDAGLPPGHPAISRFLGLPLFEGERIVALIGLANKQLPYDEADQDHAALLVEGLWRILEQRQVREELRRSEERYRTVADFTYDWEWWRGQDNRFLWVSPSCERVTGYAAEEFMRDPGLFWRIIHEEDRPLVEAHNHAPLDAPPGRLEFRVVRRDGETIWISHACQAVRGQAGACLGRRAANRDVTARYRYESALRDSERTYRTIFETTGAATVIVEKDMTISMANSEFERLAGCSQAEIKERRPWLDFFPPDERPRLGEYHNLRRQGPGQAPRTYESRFLTRSGAIRHVGVTVGLIEGTGQSVISMIDITGRKKAEEQLLYQSFYDGLTGLPNRFLFLDRLSQALERSQRRPDRLLAVLLFDLDRFKQVNDAFGRSAGDELLQTLSARLKKSVRAADTLARMGGDEFALLAEDLADWAEVEQVAAGLQQALRQSSVIAGRDIYADASIGLTVVKGGESPQTEQILRDADIAMNQAKAKGRSQCQIFALDMRDLAVRQLQIESDLRRALGQNELFLLYQPIVELPTGRTTGFEALVRWRHPRRGVLSPCEFIPVAEETGVIVPLGWWILEEACRQLKRWNAWRPRQGVAMSVNISAKQFLQPDFVERTEETLRQTGVDPRLLKLEITESVLMSAASSPVKILSRLKELDVRLCVDDFGVGYSSLTYLQKFPVDVLKIDRSFVSGGEKGLANKEIVQAVVTLAHSLGMSVVAEGIETESQLAHLRRFGCAYGQGYFFARPLPPEAARIFMERGGADGPKS